MPGFAKKEKNGKVRGAPSLSGSANDFLGLLEKLLYKMEGQLLRRRAWFQVSAHIRKNILRLCHGPRLQSGQIGQEARRSAHEYRP
jgi:hypothetical protein